MKKPPKQIRINHDDYYAQLVGRTTDGRQFFITQPFIPNDHDFVALYLFDPKGNFIDARIQDLGLRSSGEPPGNALYNNPTVEVLQRQFLESLGDFSFANIQVAPFKIEACGTAFGLIPQPPEEANDDWSVTAEPGNYMAFSPPWDGEYDT